MNLIREDADVLIWGITTAKLVPMDFMFKVDRSIVSLIVMNKWGFPE